MQEFIYFLFYIKETNSVAIETKHQDIEIKFSDKTIYAQAKSSQNESTTGTESAKFRDAILSLSKVGIKNDDRLIYISNLKCPIDQEKDKFRNDIVSFNQCDSSQKEFVFNQIEIIKSNLNNELHKPQITDKKRNKINILIERLNDKTRLEKLLISSIYPFCETEDRYKIILEKTTDILFNIMKIESGEASALSRKILTHWQNVMEFDETIADKSNNCKYIEKKNFVWTVIAAMGEKINDNRIIENSLSSFCEDWRHY